MLFRINHYFVYSFNLLIYPHKKMVRGTEMHFSPDTSNCNATNNISQGSALVEVFCTACASAVRTDDGDLIMLIFVSEHNINSVLLLFCAWFKTILLF